MNENMIQTVHLGEAHITIFTLLVLRWDLEQHMPVPVEERPARYAHFFAHPGQVPVRCIHIQMPGLSLLVDACTPTALVGTEYELPGAPKYPDLIAQLAGAGIAAEDITHVVITHPHSDHILGLTAQRDGEFVPCFPHARHYLGRADWESLEVQEELDEPGSLAHSTLAVLRRQNLLDLVDGEYDLGHGVRILPTAGETPGHQILRLESGRQTLYCLGDLYHHPIEVEQPTWMTSWSDPVTMSLSRQRLTQAALVEDAFLIAAHIPTVGRLRATAEGVRWEARESASGPDL